MQAAQAAGERNQEQKKAPLSTDTQHPQPKPLSSKRSEWRDSDQGTRSRGKEQSGRSDGAEGDGAGLTI